MRLSILPLHAPTAALVTSACATLVAIGVWLTAAPATPDACALPSGTAKLAPSAQAELARHEMACRDLEDGRISRDDYRQLLGLVELPPAAAPIQWASEVRAVSSEYSPTSWSARQVLGPPDVFPGSGDNPRAWASREADAQSEFIEVGFAHPVAMRELQLFETFNPGAIASIETISVSGARRTIAHQVAPASGAQVTRVPLACGEPIAAVRVTLASGAVAGWNELDAIGGVPCAPAGP